MSGYDPAKRIADLGRLGEWLSTRYKASLGLQPDKFVSWAAIDHLVSTNQTLAAVAASLLYSEIPLQVLVSDAIIMYMADAALRRVPEDNGCEVGPKSDTGMYHLKSHPGALNKVNVYCSEIYRLIRAENSRLGIEIAQLIPVSYDLYDDQASAWMLLSSALYGRVHGAAALALRMVLDPDGCKQLTVALKAIGANGCLLGAMLVEGTTLQGRATGDIDLVEEGRYRTSDTKVAESVVVFEDALLRESIGRLLDLELDLAKLEFDDPGTRWGKRWMWCVNGSHSRQVEMCEPDKAVDHSDLGHLFRRAYVERQSQNLLETWSGVSYFTGSKKLEHGKTRALFSCDTVTYVNFDHLLRPVEKAWRGIRVDLDPGTGGTVGMINRIRTLRETHPVCIMLDYDDFNSQHALRTQEILFEEVCKRVGYDEDRTELLVNSFSRSRVFVEGKDLGYLRGTLMTGHRATSFINSVLNYVYLDLTLPDFSTCKSIHVGDDVFLAVRDRNTAFECISSVRASSLRMQPMKQSVGSVTAEFLRTAIRHDAAYGYVCRSIASIISGNWVGEHKLDPMQALVSMVGGCWTLGNRAARPELGVLLTESVWRVSRLSRHHVRMMVKGELGINNSPCRTAANCRLSVDVKLDEAVKAGGGLSKFEEFVQNLGPNARLATNDYLTNHVTKLERYALELTGSSVNNAMLSASYSKSLADSTDDSTSVLRSSSKIKTVTLHNVVLANEAVYVRPEGGLLNKYPIISLLRGVLKSEQLQALLLMEGVIVASPEQIEVMAYGCEAAPVGIRGYLPYSDASNIGKKMGSCIVMCSSPIYS